MAAHDATPDATINYFVDHDYKLAETVGYWDWDGSGLHLRAFTKQANDFSGQGKLRCTMNGAPMSKDGWVSPGGGMGLDVTDGAHDKHIRWIRLDAKLGLVTSTEQQAKPCAIVSRTTYLPDFDIHAGIDLPFSRAAFNSLALSGRPWLGPVPTAGGAASLLAVSESVAPSASTPALATSAAPAKKAKGKGGKPKKK